MRMFDILIVGVGHGGAQTPIALRQAKFKGSIAIAGDEPGLPYQRHPFSKDYLAGGRAFERLLIRPPPEKARTGVDCGVIAAGFITAQRRHLRVHGPTT